MGKGLSRDARCLSFQVSGQSFDLFVGDGAAVLLPRFLIRLYLHGTGDSGELTLALTSAKEFLVILLFSLPFLLFLAYASSLREMGKTMVPMFASSIAVVTNTALNFLLIFGLFFFPTLGVRGAAISTLIARIVECAITMYWVHRHEEENPFAIRVYHQFHVPLHLVKQILRKGSPLMANEILWAIGQTMIIQAYSVRGLSVIASLNISSTVSNLFNIVYMALAVPLRSW